jgi:acyl-CoA thioesterase-1
MLQRLLLVALWLYVSVASAAAEPTVLVLGDSLSAGYGINDAKGWVSLLGQRLKAAGFPHRVVNVSISGDTTAGALARLPEALARQHPTVVIVELGGNDGLRGLSLDDMEHNLEQIILRSRQAGARVLLVGMRLPPNYGPAYTRAFAAVYARLATRSDVPLVPFLLEGVALGERLMQDDGLHPTEQAQPRILQNVWPHLVPLLSGGK